MNLEIKAVHFTIGDDTKEYIEKKTHRFDFAQGLIVDLLVTLTKERRDFSVEANIHFKWNVVRHIKVNAFDLIEGVDSLIDKVERTVKKEKEKIQDHTA